MSNKLCATIKIDEPPLHLHFMAILSIIMHLCFPQYTLAAQQPSQKFIREAYHYQPTINDVKKQLAYQKSSQLFKATTDNLYTDLKIEKSAVRYTTVITVTAYSSTVDQCDDTPFITANGTHVRDGIIAANSLAFGTKVQFPDVFGDKIFVVEDRMNARYSDRADIWFETREEAKQFGIKKLRMIVL